MPKKKIIDANILIRYLIGDKEASSIEVLLKDYADTLILHDITIAEIVWVLLSYYKVPKNEVLEKVEAILNIKGLTVDKAFNLSVLGIYRRYNIDYIDAYLAGVVLKEGYSGIVSYDKSLDKVAGVKRSEP